MERRRLPRRHIFTYPSWSGQRILIVRSFELALDRCLLSAAGPGPGFSAVPVRKIFSILRKAPDEAVRIFLRVSEHPVPEGADQKRNGDKVADEAGKNQKERGGCKAEAVEHFLGKKGIFSGRERGAAFAEQIKAQK